MAKTKKDLDKDMMFQKIMPVLADNPFSSVPSRDEPAAPSGELSALRSRLSQPSAAPEHPMPKNLMEFVVEAHIDEVIRKFNCCPCNRCRSDIAVLALNTLPPSYAFGTPEELEQQSTQIDVKIAYNALIKAVLQVRAHPNH